MHAECAMECRQRQLQYFWEVFPAQDGTTTYMFAYTDPSPGMPTRLSNRPHQCLLRIVGLPDQQCSALPVVAVKRLTLCSIAMQIRPCSTQR